MKFDEIENLKEEYIEFLEKIKLTRLQKTMYNIFSINADLQNNWILIEKHLENIEDRYLIHTIHYYSLIQVCSFLEEYKILEQESVNNELLRKSLYILSPAIRRVRKYTGLKKLRNSMLAHYNRDSTGDFQPYWKIVEDKNYPKTENDINLILELIIGVGNKLHQRHFNLFRPAIEKMEYEKNKSFKKSFEKSNYIKTKENYLLEKRRIIKEIVEREMEPINESFGNFKNEIEELLKEYRNS